jgi:hypothetical protein
MPQIRISSVRAFTLLVSATLAALTAHARPASLAREYLRQIQRIKQHPNFPR